MKGQIVLTEFGGGLKVAFRIAAIAAYKENDEGVMIYTNDGRSWHMSESFYDVCDLVKRMQ